MRNFNLLSSHRVCTVLGGRIRALRLTKNITQQELAQMTASSLSSIKRAETTGQMTLDLFVRLAQALYMTDALESLFVFEPISIDATLQQAASAKRQRARSQQIVPLTAQGLMHEVNNHGTTR
jgi:transcriptional regulator with XRE-family HTH domain